MTERACVDCLRRGWLLAELNGVLAFYTGDESRLEALHALSDEELIAALGGRHRGELLAAWRAYVPGREPGDAVTICGHCQAYPSRLHSWAGGPRAVYLRGCAQPFGRPLVAIVGTGRPSDYGVTVARKLGRTLAGCGVTVVAALAEGISAAALQGALGGAGRPLALLADGPDVCRPARLRALRDAVLADGLTLSELPGATVGRAWSRTRRELVLGGICEAVIVVESEESERELRTARAAQRLGRALGAVPGRINSPTSHGSHRLLSEGARLIGGPADVLELLGAPAALADARAPAAALPEHLARILARVSAGDETEGKLSREGDAATVMAALGELELRGLLERGDGGRYLPVPAWAPQRS